MPNMKLQSSDGEIFEVDVEVAKCFVVIKEMLEGLGMEDNEDPIPLPNVTSPILQKVIEWATHHQNNSLEPAEYENNSEYELENRSKVVSLWDIEFLQVDQGTLFELILAANYLNIKSLLDAGCKTIANMIKGKRPEEIRQTFNIRNDFTSEEIENLDRDHRWREDD